MIFYSTKNFIESWRQSLTLPRPRIQYRWEHMGDRLELMSVHIPRVAEHSIIVDLNYGIQ